MAALLPPSCLLSEVDDLGPYPDSSLAAAVFPPSGEERRLGLGGLKPYRVVAGPSKAGLSALFELADHVV